MKLPVTFVLNQESNAVINIRLVSLPPQQWPKVGPGAAKYHLKKGDWKGYEIVGTFYEKELEKTNQSLGFQN